MMKRYDPSYTFYQVWGGSAASTYNNYINAGCSWFNYRGYIGMSGWSSNDMEALTNTDKLVNGSFITCGTGQYANSSESPSEKFIRAGSPTSLKGGVTAIGMSTIHTITSYNNCLNMGIFHGLFVENLHDMGQAFLRGKLNLHKNYGTSDLIQARTFSQISNLFGDPSMDVWLTTPKTMAATYPTSINKGCNYLPVTVRDASNHLLKDVWVTISKTSDSLFATGYTDVNGQIVLPVNQQCNGTINIVITKPNYVAVIGTIAINSSQASIAYNGSTIDDDNTGGSVGNSNNVINAGETIELRVALNNYLAQAVSGATAILRSTDPYINISDSVETFATIPAGGTATSIEDYDFTVANNCPNQHIAPFYLIVSANSTTYTSYFNYTIGGVDIDIVTSAIQDNANHILDPNETTSLQFTVINNGLVPLTNITAKLKNEFSLYTDNRLTCDLWKYCDTSASQ